MISSKAAWLTKLAWIILLFNALLIFLVPGDTFRSLLPVLLYLGWLLLSSTLVLTWLSYYHRTFFRRWRGWAISVVLVTVILFFTSSNILSLPSQLSLFFSVLIIPSLWLLFLASVILLWYRDVGLALLGWGSIIYVWSLFLSWRYQGNLLELWLYSLNYPDAPSPLWWLNTLFCLSACIFPVAIFSLLGHTVRLIIHELRLVDVDVL
jgi:hypothetical protein